MTHLIHFLNGTFVSEDKLLISPRDLGFARGYAVTDYLVTYNHQPFKLTEHIDMLFKSAEIIGLQIPWSKIQVATWVKETVDKNDTDTEKTIKIYLTGGESTSMHQAEVPTIIIIIDPFTPQPSSYYEKGIKVVTVKYKRPYPEAKHTHAVERIRQHALLKNDDIEEIIYYDDTQVFEGSGNNLFAVINNTLVTTKSNVVHGIPRSILIEILQLPIPVEVRDFTIQELLSATEIFLPGTRKGIRGVTHINGKEVGDGTVGPITKEAARQYAEYIRQATS